MEVCFSGFMPLTCYPVNELTCTFINFYCDCLNQEEDIESLLEYHGFLVKDFEEPYMVKEGPFSNSDRDHPTKRSKLVHLKRSKTIIDDVISYKVASQPPEEKKIQSGDVLKTDSKKIKPVPKKASIPAIDAEMQDFRSVSSPKHGKQEEPVHETSPMADRQGGIGVQIASPRTPPSNLTFGRSSSDTQPFIVNQWSKIDHPVVSPKFPPWNFPSGQSSPSSQPSKDKRVEQPHYDGIFGKTPQRDIFGFGETQQITPRATVVEVSSQGQQMNCPAEEIVTPPMVANNDKEMVVVFRDEESSEINEDHEKPDSSTNDEVAEAKLKLILRSFSIFQTWSRFSLQLYTSIVLFLSSGCGNDAVRGGGSCVSIGSWQRSPQ